MVCIKDVAKLAGVSKSTVSNVINNAAKVSPKKIRKVQEAIKELEYKPNAAARSLKTKETKNIGVILPNITDSNFSLLFTGIERILSENGYTVSLYTTSEIPVKENHIIDQIHQQRMDGVIIVTCQPNEKSVFEQLEASKIRMVFIEREVKGKEFNFIEYDNYRSIFNATIRYLNLGYKNIFLVTGPEEYSSEMRCINGYRDAFKSFKLKHNDSFIRETNFNKESSFKAIMKLFQGKDIPEVIITSSTQIVEGALKVISILKGCLIKKPEVVSLCEYSWSCNYYPSIAKIQRRSIKLGEIAAEKLIENIKKPFLYESVHLKIDNIDVEDIIRRKDKKHAKKSSKSDFIKVLMMDSSAYKSTRSLLSDFEQEEEIDVQIDALSIDELYKKIYTESLKDNYDVFQIDIPWFAELADCGYLFELNKFIRKDPEVIADFVPGVLDAYSKFKNNYYALPYMFGTQLLFYRKDLFEDIGIKNQFYELYHSELKPPKTWKEFNIIARFFTRSFNPESHVEYGTTLGAKFPTAAICEALPRMWAYGRNNFDDKGCFSLDERGVSRALKNYTESFRYTSPGSPDHFWDEEVEEFSQGKAAMMILFVAHATDITDRSKSKVVGKIGYDIIPGGVPVLGGWSLGINNNSSKKEQAFSFIKWATSREMAIPYTILGGFTPRINLFKSSELLALYPWLPKALESFALSRRRTVSKVTTGGALSEREFEKIYGEAVVKSIKKQSTPEEAVKEANNKIKKIMLNRQRNN